MASLALFATLASTFIIQRTTVILGPARVMAYIYLSPVFVTSLTLLIEDKTLPNAIYPGLFLSIAATIILQLHNSAKERENFITAIVSYNLAITISYLFILNPL
jgi:drug/metabolite transporter (DMT)-like permease